MVIDVQFHGSLERAVDTPDRARGLILSENARPLFCIELEGVVSC
jgi:hypothetical protein